MVSVVDVGDDEDGLGPDPPGVQQPVGRHLGRHLDVDVPAKEEVNQIFFKQFQNTYLLISVKVAELFRCSPRCWVANFATHCTALANSRNLSKLQ